MHRKRQSIEKHEETQHHSRYYFWIKKLWMTPLPHCSLTSTCSCGQTLLPHSHSFSTLPEEGNSRYQSLWKHQRKPNKDSNSTLGAGGKRREEMLALLIPQDSKALAGRVLKYTKSWTPHLANRTKLLTGWWVAVAQSGTRHFPVNLPIVQEPGLGARWAAHPVTAGHSLFSSDCW